jgi:hypothetical protein
MRVVGVLQGRLSRRQDTRPLSSWHTTALNYLRHPASHFLTLEKTASAWASWSSGTCTHLGESTAASQLLSTDSVMGVARPRLKSVIAVAIVNSLASISSLSRVLLGWLLGWLLCVMRQMIVGSLLVRGTGSSVELTLSDAVPTVHTGFFARDYPMDHGL